MRFHWLRDRVAQKQFGVEWAPGNVNLADYTTKHHSGIHHKKMRPIQLYIPNESPSTLQGCVRIMNSKPVHGKKLMLARRTNALQSRRIVQRSAPKATVTSRDNPYV